MRNERTRKAIFKNGIRPTRDYSDSYGGRRGGFKMSAAKMGTSRHKATKMAICAGLDCVGDSSLGLSCSGGRAAASLSAYSVFFSMDKSLGLGT